MFKWVLIIVLVLAGYFFIPASDIKYDSDHFRDGRFHNTAPDEHKGSRVFGSAMKVLFGSGDLQPSTPPPAIKLTSEYVQSDTNGALEVTWVSHACLLIKYNDMKILTDPVFSERASFSRFIGPKRFESIQPIEGVDTGELDAVIISHNHYDHLDKKAVTELNDRTRFFIVSLGVGQYLTDWGVSPDKIIELDWGGSFMMKDLVITAAPASHMSKRGLFDRNKTFWSSFVIEPGEYKLYFSADTGYIPDFRTLGETYGGFDLAMLDIGAYNKAWKQNHMTPEEAVQAASDLKAAAVLPIHWGTFQLSDFVWTEPIERFTKEADQKGLTYTTPIQGEPVNPGVYMPADRWWESVR
ncbi:MAG: MBL fold metallo-hydrolase [Deferribacterales bacterium]